MTFLAAKGKIIYIKEIKISLPQNHTLWRQDYLTDDVITSYASLSPSFSHEILINHMKFRAMNNA